MLLRAHLTTAMLGTVKLTAFGVGLVLFACVPTQWDAELHKLKSELTASARDLDEVSFHADITMTFALKPRPCISRVSL